MRYVALLRGINVGGTNNVSMADLRSWVTALGHVDVSTYINSGNVVFTAAPGTSGDAPSGSGSSAALAGAIEERITQESGLRIFVLVRSHDELVDVAASNPYPDDDPSKVIIGFMNAEPDADTVAGWAATESGDDEITVIDSVVYLYCPAGLGRSKLGQKLLGRQGSLGTTRNLRTVRKLVELSA